MKALSKGSLTMMVFMTLLKNESIKQRVSHNDGDRSLAARGGENSLTALVIFSLKARAKLHTKERDKGAWAACIAREDLASLLSTNSGSYKPLVNSKHVMPCVPMAVALCNSYRQHATCMLLMTVSNWDSQWEQDIPQE